MQKSKFSTKSEFKKAVSINSQFISKCIHPWVLSKPIFISSEAEEQTLLITQNVFYSPEKLLFVSFQASIKNAELKISQWKKLWKDFLVRCFLASSGGKINKLVESIDRKNPDGKEKSEIASTGQRAQQKARKENERAIRT